MSQENKKHYIDENQKNFRACIPFYVLFDPDLSANEIRLYGLIEQMESCTGQVFYTNRKIAQLLGISHKSNMIIHMANKLKKKGYIKRESKKVTINDSVKELYIWNTVKTQIHYDNYDIGVPEVQGRGVPEVQGRGVPEVHPCNTHNIKSHKDIIISANQDKKNTTTKIIISDSQESQKEKPVKETKSNVSVNIQDIINVYHEVLPDLPRVRVVDSQLEGYIKRLRNDWHKYSDSCSQFTIEAFRGYLVALREHPELNWLTKPYLTKSGNEKKNGLRTLIRPLTIAKVRNGEFTARQ